MQLRKSVRYGLLHFYRFPEEAESVIKCLLENIKYISHAKATMNIKRCQIPAKSGTVKMSNESSVANTPVPTAIIFRSLVVSINAAAIAKKVNAKPVTVANAECKVSSSSLNGRSGIIGAW